MANSEVGELLSRAAALLRAGRLQQAEAAYVELLQRHPNLPDSWYNLARLQRRAGRFQAALASYQQALEHGVSMPEEVHLNRGVIFSDCLRQDEAAQREWLTALTLNPSYVPALLNLANLHEDYGRREDALSLYEKILTLQPQHPEALARYASLKSASSPDEPLIASLEALLRQPGLSAAQRASLGFALGKMLDGCAAYDRAFAAYAEANRHSRASAGPQAPRYDRRAQEALIDELIATFSQPSSSSAGSATPLRPIFICGMFRSGSTLVEQVLAGHPSLSAGGELPFLPVLVRDTLAPFPASMARVSEPQLQQLARQYLDQLARAFPGASCVTDKRPDNFLYIGLIKRLFPDARIVHTRRDPLDNCLSIFFLHLDQRMSYALDLLDTAHFYQQYRRLMAHWHGLYGQDIFDFDYDAFVRDPQPMLARLLAFCGLHWHERCLSFERTNGAVKTASVWQVRQPLYQSSSGRWRNYAGHLQAVRDYLAGVHDPQR